MRVLVTGGAGFIGANLVAKLAAAGHDAVVLDDLSTGSADNLADVSCELVVGSILDVPLLVRLCNGADAIVHLAARPSVARSVADPLSTHEINATGTLRVLEAARQSRGLHTIVASSSSVYGETDVLPKVEDLPTVPRSPYAASKLASEGYSLAYLASYELPVLAFRFFNVFGPFQPGGHAYAAVIPAFIEAALAGRPLPVHGDGLQTRDFTYVGSVADIILDALARRVTAPGPVNLAFGTRRTLLEVAETLEAVLGHPIAVEHRASRPGDVRHSQADTTRLRALFPTLEPVAFAHGLAETIAWWNAAAPILEQR